MTDLAARARDLHWYHTMELAPGLVTPGVFDLRDQVHHYGLPDRLDGMRVLDIGTLSGFWAFELERRGAAEIYALDVDDEMELDWPPRRRPDRQKQDYHHEGLRLGAGRDTFALAKEAFGSKANRVAMPIYRATPEELGTFDLVFCGSVLMHVRDQLLALERICDLVKPGGRFISAEEYDPYASALPIPMSRFRADRGGVAVFWQPGIRTWGRMIWTAGFDDVKRHKRFKMDSTEGWTVRHIVHHARKPGA
jgi:tRNA (mo5U34)-methyltransferase